jgi:hypothetical protein
MFVEFSSSVQLETSISSQMFLKLACLLAADTPPGKREAAVSSYRDSRTGVSDMELDDKYGDDTGM